MNPGEVGSMVDVTWNPKTKETSSQVQIQIKRQQRANRKQRQQATKISKIPRRLLGNA